MACTATSQHKMDDPHEIVLCLDAVVDEAVNNYLSNDTTDKAYLCWLREELRDRAAEIDDVIGMRPTLANVAKGTGFAIAFGTYCCLLMLVCLLLCGVHFVVKFLVGE